MSYAKLTLGLLVYFALHLSSTSYSQSDCANLNNFDFSKHWGQLSLNTSLENYFNSLDRRDGWAAILFSEKKQVVATVTRKGGVPLKKEAQEIINHFESGAYLKPSDRFRVVVEDQAAQSVHWVVKNAQKIQGHLVASDFRHFFFTRPNETEDIDYCSRNMIIKSWTCWVSFRAFPNTVLLKGATVLLFQQGKLMEQWEWVDFHEVLKGWDLADN